MLCKPKKRVIVGIDESGRGSLIGPVVAAAVIIKNPKSERTLRGEASGFSRNPKQISDPKSQIQKNLLKDSKKLSTKRREEVYAILKNSPEVEWGIGRVSEKVIDKINILEATKLAMVRAVINLKSKIKNQKSKICLLLIDGNFGIDLDIPQKSVIRGDEKVFLIKLASIVAKVVRDRAMLRYHKRYPQYRFDKHKGYGTKLHFETLKKYGPCKIHRKTFKPIREYQK